MSLGLFSLYIAAVLTLLLSLPLALYLMFEYKRFRHKHFLWLSAAFWLFSIDTLLELLFSMGISTGLLVRLYLFIAAAMVNLLVIGVLGRVVHHTTIRAYKVYSVLTLIFLAYSVLASNVSSVVVKGIVSGSVSSLIIIASSLITIPGAFILAGSSLYYYIDTRRIRTLSIFAGILIMSTGGFLYIASMPAVNYYADFIGILLLWIGVINI